MMKQKKQKGEQKVLKQVHKLIIAIILCFTLSAPSIAVVNADTDSLNSNVSQNEEVGLVQNEMRVEDSNIEPINTNKVKQSVVPDPSKEGKKVIGLFFKVMVAVAFSIVLIYVILFFIKKRYFINFSNVDSEELENLDLSTPNNKNDALKSFLNRTK